MVKSTRVQFLSALCLLFVQCLQLGLCLPAYAQYGGPPLPQTLPTDLDAHKYYELGVNYKLAGWTELSRQALEKSTKLDPKGNDGQLAKRYLQTKLPAHKVPQQAIQMNIDGFNLLATGNRDAAEKTWKEAIKQYPNFEWPYSNLSGIYLAQNQLSEAESCLKKAIEINPFYTNALLRLAVIKKVQKDLSAAKSYALQALKADPDDPQAKKLLEELQ